MTLTTRIHVFIVSSLTASMIIREDYDNPFRNTIILFSILIIILDNYEKIKTK